MQEERKRRENKPALERGAVMERFIQDWLLERNVPLTAQLGVEYGPPLQFLMGIFIATMASKQKAPFFQEVIEANTAHMTFGKCTLISAYTNTTRTTGSASRNLSRESTCQSAHQDDHHQPGQGVTCVHLEDSPGGRAVSLRISPVQEHQEEVRR